MAVGNANLQIVNLVQGYLADVSKVLRTGAGTVESSYYPALNNLLSGLGALGQPRRGALSAPKGIHGDYPDVALYEVKSNVLVLPVEAKGTNRDIVKLAKSAQARRYAITFGGGRVLVTNVMSFAVSELDPATGKMVLRDRVDLVESSLELQKVHPAISENAAERLASMLEAACTVRGSIQKPERVAQLLAYHGRLMISAIQEAGNPADLLAPIEKSFVEGLEMKLDDKLLVPTTVQTLLYGLFAAWLDTDEPQNFEWIGASYGLTLPVYADMVHSILTPKFVRQCNLPSQLEAAARMLSWVDRDQFEKDFDGGAIEYFYEPFLAEFDDELRNKMGVWYTPRPIAEYQTVRVNHHLKTDLAIADGLASTDQDVYVLDPACGTGTYITAVLRHIREHHLRNGEPELIASQRAADAARERVIGFELLPAAFVIAHININRLLASWNVPFSEGQRARIYLTNSLTGWEDGSAPPTMPLEELASEIISALEVKGHEPVIAVIGNPPYEGYSAAESKAEKELLKPWVDPLYSRYGIRKHRLGDLYVRFWRIAVQKIASLTGRGVVSYITNRKWLGGRSFPLMRESICLSFDEIIVDDCHGDVHEKLPGDESVFRTKSSDGIRVGAAIVTAVRGRALEDGERRSASVSRRDLTGPSKDKHAKLASWAEATDVASAMSESLVPITTDIRTRWRLSLGTFADAPTVDDYLAPFYSGVQLVKDEAFADPDQIVLSERIEALFDYSVSYDQLMERHPELSPNRSTRVSREKRDGLQVKGASYDSTRIHRFAFKPFSYRWFYWDTENTLIHRPRNKERMRDQWTQVGDQISIVLPQTARRPESMRPFVTRAVPSNESVDPNARVFPRRIAVPLTAETRSASYADVDQLLMDAGFIIDDGGAVRTSVRPEWLDAARAVGAEGSDDTVGDLIFFALIGIMHSPRWAKDQPAQLDDFPAVPLPSTLDGLEAAASLGREIVRLSDIDQAVDGVTSGLIRSDLAAVGLPTDLSGAPVLTLGRRSQNGGQYEEAAETILWNATPGNGWSGVSRAVWDYQAGGFQVIPKHLAYLVGQPLSSEQRQEVMALCRRIAALIALGADCDAVYEEAIVSPLELAVADEVSAAMG